MSISNIGVSLPHVPSLTTVARPTADPASRAPVQQEQAPATALRTSAQPATTSRTSTTLGGPTHTLPAEAPPGTDPELWSVLTADERAFFAKAGSSGPLTYGRTTAPRSTTQPTRQSPPLVRGGRLDVKV